MITLSSCLIWQIIRFILPPNEYGCVYAWTTLRNIATDWLCNADLAKKIIFSDEAHFDLGGYLNKQNCRIWDIENSHSNIEKVTHPKRVTVRCGFWSRVIIGLFFFENEQEEAVTINGDRYRAMFLFRISVHKKLKRRILPTFGFNRAALCATHPKLHLMFCTLFLKIVLSFGYLGAAIWHRWTIICGVPPKISVTPTNQRQLTL